MNNEIISKNLALHDKLILTMLTNAVNEGKIITKADIIKCFLDYKFWGNKFSIYSGVAGSRLNKHKNYVTRIELERYFPAYCEKKAISWFMLHFASTIIKGKLVTIPIIEL